MAKNLYSLLINGSFMKGSFLCGWQLRATRGMVKAAGEYDKDKPIR
jgi:hypothetical protein